MISKHYKIICFICAMFCLSCRDLSNKTKCNTGNDCISGYLCSRDKRCIRDQPGSDHHSNSDSDPIREIDSETDSEVECVSPVLEPGEEVCNNLDDDCNGAKDDGIHDECLNHDLLRQCIDHAPANTSCADRGLMISF